MPDPTLEQRKQQFEDLKQQLTPTDDNPEAPYNLELRNELEKLQNQANASARSAKDLGWTEDRVQARKDLHQGIKD